MKVTLKQHWNLQYASQVMWPAIKPFEVVPGLLYWATSAPDKIVTQGEARGLAEHPCGTQACFGGWCAVDPCFQAQGVRQGEAGAPAMGELSENKAFGSNADRVAAWLFGGSYRRDSSMFTWLGDEDEDREFTSQESHAEVASRLAKALGSEIDPDSEGFAQLEALRKAGFELALTGRLAGDAFKIHDPEDDKGYRLAGHDVPALVRLAFADLLKEAPNEKF